jgi:glycosyltransferase involved in cell wall biosynthesis
MIVANDVIRDARVRKEADSLAANGWRVVVVGIAPHNTHLAVEETLDGFTIRRVVPRLSRFPLIDVRIVRALYAFVLAAVCLRRVNARVYHAHDFSGLLIVALAMIYHRPVVYDSHEIFFERPLPPITHHLTFILRPLERTLARRATRMIATTQHAAQYFVGMLGVDEPVVVRNAVDLRKNYSTGIPIQAGGRRLVAHSGWLIHGRHLTELIEALCSLPETVAILLVGDGPYRNRLESIAQSIDATERLLITGEVLPEQMVGTLQQAAVAVVLITTDYISYRFSLPNKFFEAVAAGLPTIASPIPEVKQLIEAYDIGVLCDPTDARSIAHKILAVLEPDRLAQLRENVRRAQQDLNWEAEEKKLVALYRDVFSTLPKREYAS